MITSEIRRPGKLLHAIFAVLALFIVQTIIGKAGSYVADAFSYAALDPDDVFAWQWVHHIVLLLAALGIISILRRLLKADFGFHLGDIQKGMRFVAIFTGALMVISLAYHVFMYVSGQPLTYPFALNARNVLGTLGFQLLLSGPAEEMLYRALPITAFLYIYGKSSKLKWNITLEVIIASLLFSLAHVKWSLFPFSVEANVFQLFYAFAIGSVQGIAYKESRSILYPILMHSISNVLMVGTGYLFAAMA